MDVDNFYIINGIKQRFEAGIEWENTDYYCGVSEDYKNGEYKQKGFDDLQKYLEYRCEKYETLFKNIKEEGYNSRNKNWDRPGQPQPVRNRLEVLVAINRNGQILFYEGNHRFGIARVLDIKIPAHVVCRHKEWQEFRDNIYKNGFTGEHDDELRNHPDLQDVVD